MVNYQLFWGGASNQSEIFTSLYNDKKKHVLEVIEKYLSKNPEDVAAKEQRDRLLNMPEIKPLAFGNTALWLWEMERYSPLEKYP